MRNAFAAELLAIAERDPRLVMLSGDIGNRLFDNYKARFADRFLNCGVAEANMIGVAAGMALCGLRPIAYTITSFITTRCLEQIRLDVCYHNLPVVIVGVGAGLSYAGLGATHHSLEDIAFLRVLPGMTVICPGDAVEVRQALRAAVAHNGPVYIRIGKKGEPVIHQESPDFVIGKSIRVRDGDDVCILSTGNMLPSAVTLAEGLEVDGISTRLDSMHTVKPLDDETLREVFAHYSLVVTMEEHSRLGGFGAGIAEWLAMRDPQKARLLTLATEDRFLHEAGGQEHARRCFSLAPDRVLDRVRKAFHTAHDG